ncbi:MAG: hypothetical protein COW03_02510 [Cytophagales bacterium CG12_big_fil_rev_8_21_14_0_65_40_12]|nr:MAG: hypothetical protein COW03_02510 [Cytophagales bacterium CG12_big_fil_rev_8_21_14_0_65_40_12]PIW03417.1 MAG: hypothetical protein COW40_14755 [Cytophagales bacterium CG17_big_fil_post_rev_8_21_14_2_50_40_13]
MKEENKVKVPMGYSMETFKDMPKDIITHMPFIMFAPKTVVIQDKEYIPMHFLYFFKNLDISNKNGIENGHVFDEMPKDSTLTFEGVFKENVGYSVIRQVYYFNRQLSSSELSFKMNISESDKVKYNLANRDNRIKLKPNLQTTFGPEFLTEDCVIIIPPPTL